MNKVSLSCKICGELFRKESLLKNHVRRDHQSLVKVKFRNGGMTEVKKRDDDMFKCNCGKSFTLPTSLQRHARDCNGDIVDGERIEGEDVSMKEGDSVASEATILQEEDVNDTPMDCFGALISCEFG